MSLWPLAVCHPSPAKACATRVAMRLALARWWVAVLLCLGFHLT